MMTEAEKLIYWKARAERAEDALRHKAPPEPEWAVWERTAMRAESALGYTPHSWNCAVNNETTYSAIKCTCGAIRPAGSE